MTTRTAQLLIGLFWALGGSLIFVLMAAGSASPRPSAEMWILSAFNGALILIGIWLVSDALAGRRGGRL